MLKFYIEAQTFTYKPPFFKRSPINLVEIALLDESGKNSYWAVSKEFNLRQAWNNEKFRRTVLLPIHKKLADQADIKGTYLADSYEKFTKSSLKNLLSWFGKTSRELRDDIRNYFDSFIDSRPFIINSFCGSSDIVALCELFNNSGELPYFLRYLKDLESELDMLTNYDEKVRKQLFTVHPTFPKTAAVGKSTSLEEVYWLRDLDNFLEKYKIKND